jgi:hypothetical protein
MLSSGRKENVYGHSRQAQRKAHANPVAVDSKHYKVELENDQVRVLRIKYRAHDKSVLHGHPNGVAVFLTDAHFKFSLPDGKTEEPKSKAGEIIWLEGGEYLPENLSEKPLRQSSWS